jgi:hypothetical protein
MQPEKVCREIFKEEQRPIKLGEEHNPVWLGRAVSDM